MSKYDKDRVQHVTAYINENLCNFKPGDEGWWYGLGKMAIDAVDSYKPIAESNVAITEEK